MASTSAVTHGAIRDPRFGSRTSARVYREPMSDIDELQLRREYGSLPKGPLRWKCSEGQLFLKQLSARVDKHGPVKVAEALDITRAGLATMLDKAKSDLDWGDELPSADEMRDLLRAYDNVKRLRAAGKRASRGTPQYFAMHSALSPLVDRYDLVTIAVVSKVPRKDLERFLPPPDVEALTRYHLVTLVEIHSGLSAGALERETDNSWRFLNQLHLCHNLMSRIRIARALNVDPERVSGWLRWRESLMTRRLPRMSATRR